jgi:predicted MFS family arabinose efflux permease
LNPTDTPGAAPAPALPLLVLCLAAFSSLASMRACDALLPMLADEFATTPGTAAQTVAAFAFAYGTVQFLVGPLGDRMGRLRVMAAACVIGAVGNVAVLLATTLEAMTAARVLAGAASGGIVPMSLALIGDAVAFERRQQTLARLMLATHMGMIAGLWLGGMLAEALGWRAVFAALALGFTAVSVPLLRQALRSPASTRAPLPGAPGGLPGAFAGFAEVLRVRWARWIVVLVGLEGALVFATLAFVPTFLHDSFGLTLGQAGAVMALYAAAGLVYAPLAGRFAQRLGERGQALGGACAIGAAAALLAASRSWPWAVPACLLAGLGFFMLHSTLQLHATQMAPERRATAISLFVISLFGGQALGVALAAWIVDHGSVRAVFVLTAVTVPLIGLAFRHGLARHAHGALSPGRAPSSP